MGLLDDLLEKKKKSMTKIKIINIQNIPVEHTADMLPRKKQHDFLNPVFLVGETYPQIFEQVFLLRHGSKCFVNLNKNDTIYLIGNCNAVVCGFGKVILHMDFYGSCYAYDNVYVNCQSINNSSILYAHDKVDVYKNSTSKTVIILKDKADYSPIRQVV